ncbi:MAG: hypothetical protein DWI54_06240 [Chloroflexi bacterium]|nr:MAG: hypothetical protein DWI54_06240 [Chloroflexota bacterium]RLT34090.1 MAG: hypothetical protein DWI55_00700 [Chloroflexota bacterium]
MFWVTVVAQIQPFSIALGGDTQSMRRGLDKPFLNGFWPPEPDNWTASQPAYRWSTPQWQIQWPMAGRGMFVSTTHINASAWETEDGVTLTWSQPTLGTTAPLRERRVVSVLTTGDGLRAGISVMSARLPAMDDRRDLGVIVTKSMLRPLAGTWRPVQLVMSVLMLGVLWAIFVTWRTRHRIWYSTGVILLYSIAWHVDPLWWLVHSQAIGTSAVLAAGFAFVLVRLVLPESTDRVRWWWLTTLSMVVPLIALRSPFLLTSDSAMHVRMLFDVMRGNLFQIAELPCEAGALTAPYPPLVYLLAAPFALFTWNRDAGIDLLMTGTVVAHGGALLYLLRVARNTEAFDWTAGVFLLLAACSMPFLQSVHIGELSNAWGLAVLLIAVTAWHDERASLTRRTILGAAALLAHTGIALSFGLTLLTMIGYAYIRTRRIPRGMLIAGICIVLIAVGLTYSAYSGLAGQSAKYPGCPPGIAVATKMSLIPSALPFMVVCLGFVGLYRARSGRVFDMVMPALVVAVISIGVLVFRDTTVRWAMVVYPFLALCAIGALARVSARGLAGKVLALTLGIGVPTMVMVRFWERIYTYLH